MGWPWLDKIGEFLYNLLDSTGIEFIQSFNKGFFRAFFENNRYIGYFKGIVVTLQVSLFAVLLGVAIGIFLAIIKYSYSKSYYAVIDGEKKTISYHILKALDAFCNIYISVIRGTPVLLQLLIIYNMIFTQRDSNPVVAAILCFGINSGAYVAEIIRAGIMSIDKGQAEAGKSLGLGSFTIMKSIILPQAIKNILPALGNEFIVLVKETSIVGYISLIDVTQAAQLIGSRTLDVLAPLIIAAVFYLIIVLILTKLLRGLERRLAKSDRG